VTSPAPPSGPRLAALIATRRWLILLFFTVAWGVAALLGLLQFGLLTTFDRVAVLLSIACAVAAWILRTRTVALAVMTCAPAMLVLAAAVDSSAGSASWISLSASASQVAFGIVLLGSRCAGLIGIGAVACVLGLIWVRRPSNVLPGLLIVANGWLAIGTMMASSFALWFAWHRLKDQAKAVDQRVATWESITVTARQQQQRARLWREAVAQLHETLLTTIRYVLQTPTLDPAGLVDWRARQAKASRSELDWREAVTQATAARIGAGIVEMQESLADLPIDSSMREPVRSAVFEAVSNAVRHGEATRVVVTGGVDNDGIWIAVTDNGRGPRPDSTPGLGWSEVLDGQLRALAGSWTFQASTSGSRLLLRLPNTSENPHRPSSDDGFAQGRILMTWPLLAVAIASIPCAAFLPLSASLSLVLGVVIAAIVLLSIGSIGRRFHGLNQFLPLFAVAAGLIPWFTFALEESEPARLLATTLVQTSALAALIQAAGYTVITLTMWSRVWIGVLGLVLWGSGAITLSLSLPSDMRAPIWVSVTNCLVIMPLVVSISRIGTRRFVAAQRVVEEERARIVLEATRAEVSRSINAHLESCAGEAHAIIDAVAASGTVSEEQRQRLSTLDGLIRATIQVDPVGSGGFAQAASDLVTMGFQSGVCFDVRVIDASQDSEPLPRDLLSQLAQLVASANAEVRLQVFHDDSSDYLVLSLRWLTDRHVPRDLLRALVLSTKPANAEGVGEGGLPRSFQVDLDWSENAVPADLTLTVSREVPA